jgi:hypothetical protein
MAPPGSVAGITYTVPVLLISKTTKDNRNCKILRKKIIFAIN